MEGPDGSGKTTQIDLLKKYLEKKGYDIVIAREPGGTVIGEAIRKIILNPEYEEMGHMTELLLYASARAQLVNQVIKPALAEGKAVICDRFVESSAVYQGIGRGLGVDTVYEVNNYALGDVQPKLTIFMDLDAEEGIKRKKQQAGTLSGGEQQMLAIGRALMNKPKLLMLDEPSMGLAPNLVLEIFNLIKTIHKQGTTILLVEQNANMALRIADRCYVLEVGNVKFHGDAKEMQHNDEVRKAYLGNK